MEPVQTLTSSHAHPEDAAEAERRRLAMARPESAIRYLLDECEQHRNFFWADRYHDFAKSMHGVWYSSHETAAVFLDAYVSDPQAALAQLCQDPEVFGRLAHPRTPEQNQELVAFLEGEYEYPPLSLVAAGFAQAKRDEDELERLSAIHPELYASLAAEHQAARDASAERIRKQFFPELDAEPSAKQKSPVRRRRRERER